MLGAIGLGALVIMVPFLLMLLNAFKTDGDYANNGPLSWPTHFEFNNVITYIQTVNFGQKLLNSIVMSLSISIGAVLLSLVSAYAIGVGPRPRSAWVLALFIVAKHPPARSADLPALRRGPGRQPRRLAHPRHHHRRSPERLLRHVPAVSVLGTFPKALLEAARWTAPAAGASSGRSSSP